MSAAHALIAAVALSTALAQPAAAAFTGRNGDILYSKQRAGQALDLYASRLGGGAARRLTRTPGSDELDPAASPDGTLIAYTRISLAHRGSRIWIARRDGTHRRFLKRGSEPAWSPDGKHIVFVGPRRPPAKPEIYTMRIDGTHVRRLTNNWGASDHSPAWSPDGKRIAFFSNRNATGGPGKTDIWVMDTKGRHVVNLSHNAVPNDHPAWSPDGSRILWEETLPNPDGSLAILHCIFMMNADGSDQHQVGRLEGFMPTWSPDGEQIAFISPGKIVHRYGKDILRANADGSNLRRVARLGAGFRLADLSGIDWRVR